MTNATMEKMRQMRLHGMLRAFRDISEWCILQAIPGANGRENILDKTCRFLCSSFNTRNGSKSGR